MAVIAILATTLLVSLHEKAKEPCASLALMTSGSSALHYIVFTCRIYVHQTLDISISLAHELSKHKTDLTN